MAQGGTTLGKSRALGGEGAPEKGPRNLHQIAEVEPATFTGNYQHAIDEKGRLSLPASFREILQQQACPAVVLTNFVCDGARCLDGFAQDSWQKFEKRLSSRSRFDPQLRQLENYYLARAAVCSLDSSGRIIIPTYLRNYATLSRDITFTASLYGFRIWDSRVWEMVFSQSETALLENPALFVDVDR